ncbi:MAG: thiamine biosynthesis protein ThiS [Methanomicrobiales archaeon HGW-Methanomicrobiales-3]|nr:MAG: thiamine biosynthesis protein ThiS [Methanomicrobiales archaeon HGW-Methanomicrobiales-3]
MYPLPLPSTSTIVKIILPDKSCRTRDVGPVTVESLLRELGLNPVEVLVSKNGTLVVEDAIVQDTDEVRIFRITHGG